MKNLENRLKCLNKPIEVKMVSNMGIFSKGKARVIAKPINNDSFNEMFEVKDLSEKEKLHLTILLKTEEGDQVQASKDALKLTQITKEIKAIGKQSAILLGERIAHAKKVLQNYKDRTFRDWLIFTFGSVATGYNILSYYNFYMALPSLDLKNKLKEMPRKAAYLLSQRDADVNKKKEIVEKHYNEKAFDIIEKIKKFFPIAAKKSTRVYAKKHLSQIEKSISYLKKEVTKWKKKDKAKIQELKDLLEELI